MRRRLTLPSSAGASPFPFSWTVTTEVGVSDSVEGTNFGLINFGPMPWTEGTDFGLIISESISCSQIFPMATTLDLSPSPTFLTAPLAAGAFAGASVLREGGPFGSVAQWEAVLNRSQSKFQTSQGSRGGQGPVPTAAWRRTGP